MDDTSWFTRQNLHDISQVTNPMDQAKKYVTLCSAYQPMLLLLLYVDQLIYGPYTYLLIDRYYVRTYILTTDIPESQCVVVNLTLTILIQ